MHALIALIAATWLVSIASTNLPATAVESGASGSTSRLQADQDLGRQTLPPNDDGTAIHAARTLVNGQTPAYSIDVLAAYNAANDPDLSGDVGWVPTLHTDINATQAVPGLVPRGAGSFRED